MSSFIHLIYASQSLPFLIENSPCLSSMIGEKLQTKRKTKKNTRTQENHRGKQHTRQTFVSMEQQQLFNYPPGSNCLVCWVFRWSRKLLASGGLCSSCFIIVHPDICLKQNSGPLFRIWANVETDLKRKVPSLSVDCISARNPPGSTNPIPTTSDRRVDKSSCGDGAGCESRTSILSRSTSTFISSVYSAGVWSRLGLHSFV